MSVDDGLEAYLTMPMMVGAIIGLIVIAVAWVATGPLPTVGRWLARAVAVLVVVAAFAVPTLDPLDHFSNLGGDTARKDTAPDRKADNETDQFRPDGQDKSAREDVAEPQRRGTEERDGDGGPPTRTRSANPGLSDEKWDVVPVFYGTDRARGDVVDERTTYTSDRAKRLEIGQALVTVPKAHRVPDIERPWVYKLPFTNIVVFEEEEDPAKHFTLRRVRPLDEAQFLSLIRTRLIRSSAFKDHAVVFVHGFNTSFDFALYRTAQMAYDLKFDGAAFTYSWPSQGNMLSYSRDRESAQQAEPYLRAFLNLVVKQSGAKKISVIAHSMGNQLLMPVLRTLRPSLPEGVRLSQVIFAAPDVDIDSFTNMAREIRGVSEGVTLYAHAKDRALDVSRQFWGGPRAGDVPEGGPVIVQGLDTIDVTALSTDIFDLNHSGYAENQALLNDIELLIQTGERPPEKRIPILQRIETPRGVYWRYPG